MERSRPPDEEFFHHLLGDINPPILGVDLLFYEIHGEDRGKVLGTDRLLGPWVEGRLQGAGQVCLDIVPLLRNLILSKKNFVFLHNLLLLSEKEFNETTKKLCSMSPRSPPFIFLLFAFNVYPVRKPVLCLSRPCLSAGRLGRDQDLDWQEWGVKDVSANGRKAFVQSIKFSIWVLN
jgi:hypothetical protein